MSNHQNVSSTSPDETKVITYNLNDRGRKYRGKVRNFDVPALVRAINGGVTQEKVKHRDMFGYYGHWARLKFGMAPSEGGIVDGRQVAIEPALVTTYLKAYDDGTVEHKAEFLDTNAGRLAKALFGKKTGGFSSAIDENKPEFFGFDYVLEPNFSTNRGYDIALDGVDSAMTLDDVAMSAYQQNMAELTSVLKLLDSVSNEHFRTLDVVNRLTQENEHYLGMIARMGKPVATLDSLESISPLFVEIGGAQSILDSMAEFRTCALPFAYVVPPKNSEVAIGKNPITDMFIRG